MKALVAGASLGGLTTALGLHEIGIEVRVFPVRSGVIASAIRPTHRGRWDRRASLKGKPAKEDEIEPVA